jgi:hypothetical protein
MSVYMCDKNVDIVRRCCVKFCARVCVCVRARAHVRACACVRVRAHVRDFERACVPAWPAADASEFVCACMCVHVRACSCMLVHVRARACACVRVRACMTSIR